MGARLILVARERRHAETTLARLRELNPGVAHRVHLADLSRLADMKRAGSEIAAAEPRIDVLINNAGAILGRRTLTEDGLEATFATNHMAYFVLAQMLRAPLSAAAPSRVVNTASDAHKGATLDFADLQLAKGYRGLKAYGRSKLCNILFTRELARRWAGTGVTVNCLHPGFVATRLGQRDLHPLALLIRFAMLFAGRPEKGAQTIVYLASHPELADVSGGYFHERRQITPSLEAQNDDTAKRLWVESARLAGVE
jgi:NAD(P)-dependent dehydrogenase (short-subunit alcohol dehydrogenase family)